MSVWKEIRCDGIPTAQDCFSNTNDGPKGFETEAELKAQARRRGWAIKGPEAVCPNCRKLEGAVE